MNQLLACSALGALAWLGAAPALAASVNLSEVLYDAASTDDGRLFVELWGPAGTSLEGWRLEGVNGADGVAGPIIALSGAIPGDGFFVVADATSAGTTEIPDADLLANFDFQNGPDSVVLRGAQGEVVDALGYGVFAPGEFFAGEGSPAPDPAAGFSLARVFANVDTNDNLTDFVALDVPTPGTASLAQVPEPGTAPLVAVGLTCTAFLRRRCRETPRTRLV
jgi:hypothetical protein